MKLSIIIPIYNEENTLEELLKRVEAVILPNIEKEIILIDDASTDGSKKILQNLKRVHPYLKIHYERINQGKGASIRTGLQLSAGDYIIVQDADLEYDPEDYKKLLRVVDKEGTLAIYGSRFLGDYKNMANLHYVGNKILTISTNLLYGVKLTDMETCYKLLPGNFARSLKIQSSRFNFEPEITAKILKSGLKIVEIPVSYKARSFEEGKKICWKDGLSAIATLIKFRFLS